jgi:hypothetical protein
MGWHLMPFAVGAAVGSVATYLAKDKAARDRVGAESRRLTQAVGSYMHGLLGRFGGAEEPPAPRATDSVRCEALTKTGDRCRARATEVVSVEQGGGEGHELHLCWRHAKGYQQGEGSRPTKRPQPGSERATAYSH